MVVEIDDPEIMPAVYNLKTLCLADPINQQEVARLLATGDLVRDSATAMPRIRTEGDQPAAPTPAAAAAVSGDSGMNGVMGKVMLSLIDRAQETPMEKLEQSIKIAQLMRPDPPAAPAIDVEQIVERVVAGLNGAGRPSGPIDLFEAYDKVEGLLRKYRPDPPAVPGAAAPAVEGSAAWAMALPNILMQAKQLVPEIMQGLRELRGTDRPAGFQNGHQSNGGQNPMQQRQEMTMQQRIEEVVVAGFDRMQHGMVGWDFAAYVCSNHPGGREVFERLYAGGGTVGMMGLLGMNDQAAVLLRDPGTRQQIVSFLDSFFSFGDEEAESEVPAAAAGSPPHSNADPRRATSA